MTPKFLSKLRALGDAEYETKAGKKLLSVMSDKMKIDMILAGAHIAHSGEIPVSNAYILDKLQCQKLKPDGSNLFNIAKPISFDEIIEMENKNGK